MQGGVVSYESLDVSWLKERNPVSWISGRLREEVAYKRWLYGCVCVCGGRGGGFDCISQIKQKLWKEMVFVGGNK